MLSADYQQFAVDETGISRVGERMRQKLTALERTDLDFTNKSVLDIGCDHGFWCFYAAEYGASRVLGVDRSRSVRGEGFVDLIARNRDTASQSILYQQVDFEAFEAGKNWWDLGRFDVVLMMSLYHHVYQNTGGDHASIWYWLWRQCDDVLLWENPTDARDAVVQANVDREYHGNYHWDAIWEAARLWFDLEYSGPAEHEPFREVWFLRKKAVPELSQVGHVVSGAGGASKAFAHADCRRVAEIAVGLGEQMVPGSLNIDLESRFDWSREYFRILVSDVVERGRGLDVPWATRWCRFYPVMVDEIPAWGMRFEGEHYRDDFLEVVAPVRLRELLSGAEVEVMRWR